MYSATFDPNRHPTMTTGVLMVPEETMKAMQAEIERLRAGLADLDEVMARLERLWHKLEDDGRYTDANTVALAVEKLRAFSPE